MTPGSSLIADAFERVCRDKPGAIAIRSLTDGSVQTFADLADQCSAIRRSLDQLGVGRGDAVISLVGNRPIFFPLVAACMDVGAALVPLGDATDAEAIALIRKAGASALVADRDLPVHGIDERLRLDGDVRIARLTGPIDPPQYGEATVLKLTSGSTDLPKAARTSERSLVNDCRHIVDAMGIRNTDVNLACIPLSHSYALGNIVLPLLWQGTSVALRPSFNPGQFVQDAFASGATVFPGVPFMFEHIRTMPAAALPDSLGLLITAGARIDPETVAWFHQFLHRKVHSFYGSSETGGITYDDSDGIADPLHLGRPVPETMVEVRASDERSGEGRIFVTGNAVSSGYAGAMPGAVSSFCDGGFLTGDLGYFNEQGRLVLTGRASAQVNVAGRKVDPVEVERTLLTVPGITDARVLGMPCERRGQQVVAFVIRHDSSLSPLAIRRRCASTLSTHKIPRRFVFLDRFPVDARGKINRRALEALLPADG